MDDVTRAVLAEPDSLFHDAECSFTVQVRTKGGDSEISESDQYNPLSSNPSVLAALGNQSFTSRKNNDKETQIDPTPYYFKASSIAERDQWVSAINSALRAYQREKAYEELKNKNAFRRLQPKLRSIYAGLWFQFATALLIAVNFFLTVRKIERCLSSAVTDVQVHAVVAVTICSLCGFSATVVLQYR
jgi:hypothetical protein